MIGRMAGGARHERAEEGVATSSGSRTATAPDVPRWLYGLRLIPATLPGKTRVARWLTRKAAPAGSVTIRAQGLRIAVPSIREPVSQHLLWDGIYEPDTAAFIRQHLGTHGTLLDVGANVGVFSLLAAHRWAPSGRVLAIEASPTIYTWLTRNAEANPSPRLTCLSAAVTATGGETSSFFDAPTSKFGMGGLTNRFDATAVSVRTTTVDDAVADAGLERVDVIKVDVEGHELGVFQGAQRTLGQARPPMIVFEFNDWAERRDDGTRPGDAQRYLVSQGWQVQRLQDYLRHGRRAGPIVETGGADLVAWKE